MEDRNADGEMTLRDNKKKHGQEQERIDKAGGLWRRAASCSGRTQSRIEQRIEYGTKKNRG